MELLKTILETQSQKEETSTAIPERLIETPKRGKDGLFVQSSEVGPKREIIEEKHRQFLANHFKFADMFTGLTRTYDDKGNYNCGSCNMADGNKCLLVKIKKLDLDAGSCGHWENKCAADTEMQTDYMSPVVANYGVAKNGKGYGCHRCPFASPAIAPDSRGRSLYCGKADARVFNTSCCALNGAPSWDLDEEGMPTNKTDKDKDEY